MLTDADVIYIFVLLCQMLLGGS